MDSFVDIFFHWLFCSKTVMLSMLLMIATTTPVLGEDMHWDKWWAYSGISGPKFWGVYNDNYKLCSRGKIQSPVNIFPDSLIYDPNLSPLDINSLKVNGFLKNTGTDLKFVLNKSTSPPTNFTGGPLSYQFEMFEIKFHLGTTDDIGSEHQIANKSFPIEIQIYGYNTDLYINESIARTSPHGLAVISILTTISDRGNKHFNDLVRHSERVKSAGSSQDVFGFSVKELLPEVDQFMTYEGSLTQPGCQETVTWIILNKPMQISMHQIYTLRTLTQGGSSGQSLAENNFRPIMPLNGRMVRTNIKVKQNPDCGIKTISSYNVNKRFLT